MEEKIRAAVQGYLESIGAGEASFVVERPTEAAHGDYATNAALAAAKAAGKNPRELADSLAMHLTDALGEVVSHVAVAGPGFVNITFSREAVTLAVAEADAQADAWGKGDEHQGERLSIEYGNPNPFKEMHIGHLMGAIIGEAVSRLAGNAGAAVIRDTFGGDVGPHVAKALWGLHRAGITEPSSAAEIGAAYAQGSNAYEESAEAKAEIDQVNVELYAVLGKHERGENLSAAERQMLDTWRIGRKLSMEGHRRVFEQLGSSFDYEFFDSDTIEPGLRVVNDGLAKGVFEKSEGAIIYRGEKKGLHTLVFVTSRGTPTYETKDIGLAFLREERIASDRVIITTGAEQIGHFKVFLAALAEIAPKVAEKTSHVPHGLLSLTTGKMSSRKGNVITGAGLIRDVIAKASEKNEDPLVAEQVAVGAIKFMVLRQSPGSDIVFDPEQSLSLEGDSGPYLQYALVRGKSVLAQAGDAAAADAPESPYFIERLIMHYPEVAARAAHELAPNLLVTYLLELAGEWNSFYAQERIIGGDFEKHKLMIARAFVHTMQNGLTLLGIPTPEKM